MYYGGTLPAFETGFEIVSSEPGFGKDLTGVDLNGDGLDELVVASSETVYVLYGRAAQRTETVVLSDLSPEVGFGLVPQSGLVEGVSAAGDVNGDGFEDLWVRLAPPPDSIAIRPIRTNRPQPVESGRVDSGVRQRLMGRGGSSARSGFWLDDSGDGGLAVWRLGSGQLHALRRGISGGPGALSSRRPGVRQSHFNPRRRRRERRARAVGGPARHDAHADGCSHSRPSF